MSVTGSSAAARRRDRDLGRGRRIAHRRGEPPWRSIVTCHTPAPSPASLTLTGTVADDRGLQQAEAEHRRIGEHAGRDGAGASTKPPPVRSGEASTVAFESA